MIRCCKRILIHFWIIPFLFTNTLTGQNPRLKLDPTGICINSEVNVPLHGYNLNNIGAITLYIYYSSTDLEFVEITNISEELSGLHFNQLTNPDVISIVWSKVTGVSFQDNVLLDLRFRTLKETAHLSFAIDSCEIADAAIPPQIIGLEYVPGYVYQSTPTILLQPEPVKIAPGADASFRVNGLDITAYKWQVSIDNGTQWSDLSDDNVTTGTATEEIRLISVSAEKNNSRYRCRVSRGQCVVFSEPALLLVDPIYSVTETMPVDKAFCIFPNPPGNTINGSLELPGTGSLEFELISSKGQKALSVKENICCKGRHDFSFNVVYLPIGLYLFRYHFTGKDQNQSGTCKIFRNGQ